MRCGLIVVGLMLLLASARADEPLPGCRVTLNLENVTAAEAVAGLAKTSGCPLHMGRPDLPPDRRFTQSISYEDVPFYAAVQDICRRWNLGLQRDDQGLGFYTTGQRLSDTAFVSGAVYIEPSSLDIALNSLRPLATAFHRREQASATAATFWLAAEPRYYLRQASLTLTEATDSTGRSLLPGNKPAGTARLGISNGLLFGPARLSLSLPAAAAVEWTAGGTLSLTHCAQLGERRLEPLTPGAAVDFGFVAATFHGITFETVKNRNAIVRLTSPAFDNRALDHHRLDPCHLRLVASSGRIITFWRGGLGGGRYDLSFSLHDDEQPAALVWDAIGEDHAVVVPFHFAHLPLPGSEVLQRTGKTMTPPARTPSVQLPETPPGAAPLADMPVKRIDFHATDQPLDQLLRELGRTAGNSVELPRYFARDGQVLRPAPPCTLNLHGSTWWEAIDGLVTPFCIGDSGVISMEQPLPEPGRRLPCVTFLGPVRFAIANTMLKGKSSVALSGPGDSSRSSFQLTVIGMAWMEPSAALVDHELTLISMEVDGGDLVTGLSRQSPSTKYDLRIASSFSPDGSYAKPVATRIAYWYQVRLGARENLVTIANPATPQTLQLEPGVTLDWHGAVEGGFGYAFKTTGKAGIDPNTYELFFSGRFLFHAVDGKELRTAGGRDTTGNWRIYTRTPDRFDQVILRWPVGVRVYAGPIEFRDVPLPDPWAPID